jgi:hypothetical protein
MSNAEMGMSRRDALKKSLNTFREIRDENKDALGLVGMTGLQLGGASLFYRFILSTDSRHMAPNSHARDSVGWRRIKANHEKKKAYVDVGIVTAGLIFAALVPQEDE